jgi:Sulfotransferase family
MYHAVDAGAKISTGTLLDAARTRASLNDFGDEWFLPPLEHLVAALNDEARLKSTEAGPVQRIIYSLVERLQLVDTLKRHPEILDEKVEVAGAVLGLPRTGSTMMQRLLGSSPQLTSGFWWEVTFPLPFPGEKPGDPAPRQEAARATVEAFYAQWPEFRSIHPMDAMAHDEDVMLLDKTFLSSTYDSIAWVPTYGFWMAQQDMTRAYQELRVWLQVLQSQSPARRKQKWILKSPHHLIGGLQGFLDVFPEARGIMTHRRVEEVIPSYCSMCASMTAGDAVSFDPLQLGPYWVTRFRDAMQGLIAARQQQPVGRFIDVRYSAAMEDPVREARDVMEALGLEFTPSDDAALNAWLAANGREARPPHIYTPEEFGLDATELAQEFRFYTEAFGL